MAATAAGLTEPGRALAFFLASVHMGFPLGLLYGFLRPLRPKHTGVADGVFLLALGYGVLVLTFRVCGGELRPVCFLGIFLGLGLFDRTAGRLLGPMFVKFWQTGADASRKILSPWKKFSKKEKLYLHLGKNGVQ